MIAFDRDRHVENNTPGRTTRSSLDIDLLRESELQNSIFRGHEQNTSSFDFNKLKSVLAQESQIPSEVVDKVLLHIRTHLDQLGLDKPSPTLVTHWLAGLLREQGFSLGDISLHSLELSLSEVERNIYHPIGSGTIGGQNPEATSLMLAQRIKAQYATRKVFQEEVIQAHDQGRLELMYLGAVDRPHDVFLTPDYLKPAGLPTSIGAPGVGPARRADVLLSHLIRFTHELQNHFAGNVRWGYVNTLLLPFLSDMNETDLSQFVQQMLFEFAQLDQERGSTHRKVILDLDLDIPRQLAGLTALGPSGLSTDIPYVRYTRTLHRFNEIILDHLSEGDARGNPFHVPQVVFHINQVKPSWSALHQQLFQVAMRWGNPVISFSQHQRDLGPLGVVKLNDPDFLKLLRNPFDLRGFSSNSIALNIAAMVDEENGFTKNLEEVMDLAVTAHRQKRLFISRLMAYGSRGPLQFLRHKISDAPFLKINNATQPMQIVGLGEAAAMRNGSPLSSPEALGIKARDILHTLAATIKSRNKIHKLSMHLTDMPSENTAYRFALLDLRRRPKELQAYVLRSKEQTHPIYTTGANILAFGTRNWRERMSVETSLYPYFTGRHAHTVYLHCEVVDEPSFCQKFAAYARDKGITQLQSAPDLRLCMSCFLITEDYRDDAPCRGCKSTMVVPYGLCQNHFSPVSTWCLGKRAEWKIRRHLDDYTMPVQTRLPLS